MKTLSQVRGFLRNIILRKHHETALARSRRSQNELYRRIEDAPPVRPFREALSGNFGLIAEIKQKSPSGGAMLESNFKNAARAYEESPVVHAISVLTNGPDFGMGIEDLWRIKNETSKPILRKDFITEDYEVIEARAYGADAILLMANILSANQLIHLGHLAKSLRMDVLYESHTLQEIHRIPKKMARIWGINCRVLDSRFAWRRYFLSKMSKLLGWHSDLSIKDKPLELVKHLPKDAVKIAESGVTPQKVHAIAKELGFNAALVGNSLLLAPIGVEAMLERFEFAINAHEYTREESDRDAAGHLPAFSR
jgi:indole-3-glycerol phosphate synthase